MNGDRRVRWGRGVLFVGRASWENWMADFGKMKMQVRIIIISYDYTTSSDSVATREVTRC